MRGILAAVLGAALILAPALAEARAGGGKSSGSRGSQTFQSTPAKPIERSITQPGSPGAQPGGGMINTAPRPTGQPGMAQPGMAAASRGGMFGSPFMTGLMGGFLGAGLAGMIFGNSAHAMGAEGSGAGGMIGMLLQFAMIGGLAYLGFALFRRFTGAGRPAEAAAGANGNARSMPFGGMGGGDVATVEAGPEITEDDRRAFGESLMQIQKAWSEGDLAALKRLATPEMVSYFAEDRTDAESRGERNVVDRLELLKGDVVDNWVEGNRQYATAVMTWSAIDYVERDGQVISGDRHTPVEATEAWTFLRTQGGQWLLSAIQQI
ncbi:MAG: TIM44-like domain-containing protein [Rhodospirillales bacterium]|nr:TIM44-like domain-containing protein [Rhodospirillales bacterium]